MHQLLATSKKRADSNPPTQTDWAARSCLPPFVSWIFQAKAHFVLQIRCRCSVLSCLIIKRLLTKRKRKAIRKTNTEAQEESYTQKTSTNSNWETGKEGTLPVTNFFHWYICYKTIFAANFSSFLQAKLCCFCRPQINCMMNVGLVCLWFCVCVWFFLLLLFSFFGPSKQIREIWSRNSADHFKSTVLGSSCHKVRLSMLHFCVFNSKILCRSRVIFETAAYGTFWPESLRAAEVNV